MKWDNIPMQKSIEPVITNIKPDYQGVFNPYSQELIGQFHNYTWEEISQELNKVKQGFEIVSKYSLEKRANILHKVAELLNNKKEDFAQLITQEVAKPIKFARLEVEKTVSLLKYTAEETMRLSGEFKNLAHDNHQGKKMLFQYKPLGVCLCISPYNFPLYTLTHKIAPALGAGNSIIVKPTPHAPFTAYNYIQLFLEAGLPAECISFITCDNSLTQRLASQSEINAINFTGSSNVGWQLRSQAHPGSKLLLELGGNAPVIIHQDADINKAVESCVMGSMFFSGQVCISVQRVFVHKNISQEFIKLLKEKINKLTIGNPQDENTDISSLITNKSLELLQEKLKQASDYIITGGRSLANNCHEPTILLNTNNTCDIYSQEAFAPVINIIEYSDINSALKHANETNYGLSAGIFTQDINLAFELANKLEFGTVNINNSSSFRAYDMPVTGHKQSGHGIESPYYSLRELSQTQAICF